MVQSHTNRWIQLICVFVSCSQLHVRAWISATSPSSGLASCYGRDGGSASPGPEFAGNINVHRIFADILCRGSSQHYRLVHMEELNYIT